MQHVAKFSFPYLALLIRLHSAHGNRSLDATGAGQLSTWLLVAALLPVTWQLLLLPVNHSKRCRHYHVIRRPACTLIFAISAGEGPEGRGA